ncbi:hypothetical protein [Bacillus sp. T33-2]|nr:hypothetical protein [Bacillus sp. T33-2]
MEGCMSAFAGNGQIELSEELRQLREEHPPLQAMLEELLELL